MINIGILKETKNPVDNRVAFTPKQLKELQIKYPQTSFYVESSDVRAYTDQAYTAEGIPVVNSLENCDVLFGIKEANVDSLLPHKHYFFFGHIAKMQPYNKPLIKKMMELGITFSDYEYLVDDNNMRLCAFGWWAGVVGVYNSLRAYGLKHKLYDIPAPDREFTLEKLLGTLKAIGEVKCKVVVTGSGRVSQGAQYVLDNVGFQKISVDEYLTNDNCDTKHYTVATIKDLVLLKNNPSAEVDPIHFKSNPSKYISNFMRFAYSSDVFISCHYWGNDDPVYLSAEDLADSNIRISVIGDVTCDIMGCIKSTLRPSTHAEPFYDYNPITRLEERPFSSEGNITVMAVDTCPNALALDTSEYFGDSLMTYVVGDLCEGHDSEVINRATILKDGNLTRKYSYLKEYAEL